MNLQDQAISWFLVIFGTFTPIYFLFKVLGLHGFQRLTSFTPGNTLLHRLNPLTKLVLMAGTTIIASSSIWWIGALEGVTLSMFFVPLRRLRAIMEFSFMQIVGMSWGFAVFTPPSTINLVFHSYSVIWTFPGYFRYLGYVTDLSYQALEYGFQVSMRVWAMLLASSLFLLTTTTTDVVRALESMRFPRSLTLSIMVGMAFAPRIFSVMEDAYNLQQLREEGPLYKVSALYRSLIPVSIFLFRRARLTGLALETRGFMRGKRRLYWKLDRKDELVITLVILLTVVDLVLVGAGLIPAIPFR